MNRLTKAEEEIMHMIWKLERCTVGDLRDFISGGDEANKPPHSSVSTIVRILEEKGFLDHKAYGRTYEYFPLIAKEDYSQSTLQKFAADYFDGSMNQLVSFLVKKENLDVDKLTALINQLEEPKSDDDA